MAEKNGGVRGRPDAIKKGKETKETVKLPALSPAASPTKKVKDAPSASKAASLPSGPVKTAKASAPDAAHKTDRSSRPTKLSAPGKVRPIAPLAVDKMVRLSEATEAVALVEPLTPANDGVVSHETTVGSDKEVSPAEDFAVLTATVESSPDDTTNIAALAAAAEEADIVRKFNGNGMVKLIYENYDELFPIADGSTTQTNIDEVYCLSFVMPNCLVRLSRHPNPERFQREESGQFDSLVREDPRGTYHDLEKDQVYYVVVEQASDQLRRDQEATKARWAGEGNDQGQAGKNDGRGFESCSCIYGNPCVDEYGCRDWHSRFAVSTKNGWKGF